MLNLVPWIMICHCTRRVVLNTAFRPDLPNLGFNYDKIKKQTEFMKKGFPDAVKDLPPNAPCMFCGK